MTEEATQEGALTEEQLEDKLDSLFPEEDTQEQKPEVKEQPETEEAQETEQEETETQEAEEEAEESTLTLTDVAELLGVEENLLDLNDEGKVVLKTKVDGEEGKASLPNILKSYQLEGHLNKQNMEVVNQRKALEAERTQFQQERTQKIQQLEDALTLAAHQLNHEYQKVNWEHLQQNDPQRYLIERENFRNRQEQLQNSYQQLQQTRKEEEHKKATEFQNRLQDEYRKLRTSIPGWDDDAKFDQGRKEVRDSLANDYGFSDEEITSAIDHRLIKLARDAMEYQKLQKGKPAVIKKIKEAPKVVKGGIPEQNKNDLKKTLDIIKKSGGQKGVDDYLETKLGIK